MFSHGASAESTWMIGDTVGDIRAARQAGVNAVAVTWGWQSLETLESARPNLIFEQPEALHRYFSGQPGTLPQSGPVPV
jgi:phosphoglycolate phosphatase-like HAD superfamily hydrolase